MSEAKADLIVRMEPVAWAVEGRLRDGGTDLRLPFLTKAEDADRYQTRNPDEVLTPLYSASTIASLTEQVEGLTRERDLALDLATCAPNIRAEAAESELSRLRAENEKMREDCDTYKASMKSYFEQTIRLGLAKDAAQADAARKREALEPFANAYREHDDPGVSDLDNEQPVAWHVPLGAYRIASSLSRARASLSNTSEGGKGE